MAEAPGVARPARGPQRPPAGGRAEAPESHGSAVWLITFADLVALLLAFFVMLFAMSKVDFRKWQNLTDALARGLNAVRQESAVAPLHSLDVNVAELTAGQDLDYLAGILRQQLAAGPSFAQAEITRYADRLVISVPAAAFADGAKTGPGRGGGALFHIAGVLRQLRNRIEVVAYADAEETADGELTHWELALSRGRAAAAKLRAAGYERDVIVRGRSMTQNGEAGAPAPGGTGEVRRIDLVVRLDAAEKR